MIQTVPRTPVRELFPRRAESPSSSLRYSGTRYLAPTARAGTPTTSNTTPAKRPPLGDASFLTQVQQGAALKPAVQRQSYASSWAGSAATAAPPLARSSPTPKSSTPKLTPTNCAVSLLPTHPLQHQRPLLVLDLDETLVHASVETSDGHHDIAFVVEMGGQRINVYVKIRPFAEDFLRYVSTMFEVCVFTASLAPYADKVIDYLDPTGQRVHHRLYREHCTNVDGAFVKDLNLMGRRIERVAIVDNSPVAYSFHPENAIPITSWFHCKQDKELAQLMPLLRDFAGSCDYFETRTRFEKRGCFPLCP